MTIKDYDFSITITIIEIIDITNIHGVLRIKVYSYVNSHLVKLQEEGMNINVYAGE